MIRDIIYIFCTIFVVFRPIVVFQILFLTTTNNKKITEKMSLKTIKHLTTLKISRIIKNFILLLKIII